MSVPFGSTGALVAGTLTLALPAGASNWAFLQNQDVTPLKANFMKGGVSVGIVSLAQAAAQDAPGDYLDSVGFPLMLDADTVVLTSATATAHFGSGASARRPFNQYPVP